VVHFTGKGGGVVRRLLDLGREFSIVAVALIVFVMSASVAMYLMLHQPVVRAPSVVGKPLPEAERMAEQVGLKLQVRSMVPDERAPAQIVIEQWPPPGMSVKRGQPLRVSVSVGPRSSASASSSGVLEQKTASDETPMSEPLGAEPAPTPPPSPAEERSASVAPEPKVPDVPSDLPSPRRPER